MTPTTASPTHSHAGDSAFDVEVFFDGECPLCTREIEMLRRFDRRGRIRFTDIAAAGFDASQVGVRHDELMSSIHGRLPDGAIIRGIEVFRRLYDAIGLGLIVSVTRLPGISHMLELAYRTFAKHRLRLTGRCNDDCRLHHHAQHRSEADPSVRLPRDPARQGPRGKPLDRVDEASLESFPASDPPSW